MPNFPRDTERLFNYIFPMNGNETVILTRDVEASVIPAGMKVTLQKGETAHITQSLGGSYTVIVNGNMFRIEGKDADALGLEVTTTKSTGSASGMKTPEALEKEIWEQLKTCYDPEIPVNIVDLGLIYDCHLTPLGSGYKAVVRTHRDPVAVVQSTITMLTYGARAAYRTTKPEWYRDYWTERIGVLLDASLRDSGLLPADRTVDVFFDQYMADEMGTLQRVYDAAGIELTDQARAEIAAYQASHPRGQAGQVVYDLRGDFDITPEQVRSRFTSYLGAFPIRIEVM